MTKKKIPANKTFKVVGIHWEANNKYMVFNLAVPSIVPGQKTMMIAPPTIRSFS